MRVSGSGRLSQSAALPLALAFVVCLRWLVVEELSCAPLMLPILGSTHYYVRSALGGCQHRRVEKKSTEGGDDDDDNDDAR